MTLHATIRCFVHMCVMVIKVWLLFEYFDRVDVTVCLSGVRLRLITLVPHLCV